MTWTWKRTVLRPRTRIWISYIIFIQCSGSVLVLVRKKSMFCSMFCRTEQYCSRTRVLCFFIPVHVPKLAKKENTKNIKKVNFEISVYFCIRTFLYLFPNFSRLKLSISHIPCSLASGGTWNVKHIEYPLPMAMGKDLSYLSKRSSIKLNGWPSRK